MFASAISDRGREGFKKFLPRGYARQPIAMRQERCNCPSEKPGQRFKPYFATQGYEFGAQRNVRARNLRESSYRE